MFVRDSIYGAYFTREVERLDGRVKGVLASGLKINHHIFSKTFLDKAYIILYADE